MRRLPSSAAAFALLLAVVAPLAGCGPQTSGEPQLHVYLSAPMSGPGAADGQDVADGAQLAITDAGGMAGGTAVTLEPLDDADERGWQAAITAANARTATEDSAAIAYIGELDSGASRTSIPITNEAGLLQVSPGSGAEDLTRDALGSSGVPSVQPSGSRSFGRVIPSDRAQGEAAGVWISDLGIASVEVVGGKTPFGEALVAGLEAASPGPAVVPVGEPEATFDARGNPLTGADIGGLDAAKGPLFGSDALLGKGDRTPRRCSEPRNCLIGGSKVFLTSAALDPTQLPAAADAFKADFRAAYGREPGRYAAYGYEAMAVVLDSIGRAQDPEDRSAVVDAFFATIDRQSILGTYSIDAVGNTTLGQLGAYEVGSDLKPVPTPRPLELP